MNFIKLNENWNAEPNAPRPSIKISGVNIKLSFYLNCFCYEQFNEGDMGILNFVNCLKYRMGTPNDEGFFIYGQSRYKQYGVEWGHFYLVEDSDWHSNFPDGIIIDDSIPADKLNHYLFYFKDETFEAIAESCSFRIIKAVKQINYC